MNGRERVFAAANRYGWAIDGVSPTSVVFVTRVLEVRVEFGENDAVTFGWVHVVYPDGMGMDVDTRRAAILTARADSRNAMTGRNKKSETVISWLDRYRPSSVAEMVWVVDDRCRNCAVWAVA